MSLAVLFAGVLVPLPARAELTAPYSSLGRAPVAPGVMHDWGSARASSGEQQINLLEIDPGTDGIAFETGLPADETGLPANTVNALGTTTSAALSNSSEGHRVVAAVNGDIFGVSDTGQAAALGLNVQNGELLTSGEPRPAFGVDGTGMPMIGIPAVSVTVMLPDGSTLPIDRVNQRRQTDQIVLYTPRFDSRTWTDASGTEVVLNGVPSVLSPSGTYPATVGEVRVGLGDTPMPPGQWVVSGVGVGAGLLGGLIAGDEVVVSISIDADWEGVAHSVGGPELLVQQGAIDIEPYRQSRATGVNPRTAVGLKANGSVVIVTVDGRSPLSGGLKIADMAELMRSMGAVEAVNLDGGGSTTMAVRRVGDLEVSLANRPSGAERQVNTTLQVVSSIPTGPMTGLLLSPAQLVMPVGGSRLFVAKGHDEAYNGITLDPDDVAWSTSNEAATVDGAGLVHGLTPGDVILTAELGDETAMAEIAVSSDANPPVVTAPVVEFRTGGSAATNSATVRVSWTASDGEGPLGQLELEQSVDGGVWVSVYLSQPSVTSTLRELRFRRGYQYRLRATDGAGNQTDWLTSAVYRVTPYNEVAPELQFAGEWSIRSSSVAINKRFGRNDARTAPGASSLLPFIGRQVAWIGPAGPKRGLADVLLDGVAVAQVNAYKSTQKPRRVLYVSSTEIDDGATHTVEVRNVSSTTRPFVDLDAFLVLAAE